MTNHEQLELEPRYQNSVFSSGSYLFDAIARRGVSVVELDETAALHQSPKSIITIDGDKPNEIDDGVFVQPLPTRNETYRVGVCVADASSLYKNTSVLQEALEKKRADYFALPDGERGYDPMIASRHVLSKQLSRGNVRSALVVSFIVGQTGISKEVSIDFAQVEAAVNYDYKSFSQLTTLGRKLEMYQRASSLIIAGLDYIPGGDASGSNSRLNAMNTSSEKLWRKGSSMNEAFMVAANHLVGKVMRDEGRAAIYRAHGGSEDTYGEFLEPNVAWYTQDPGIHKGLRLDPYCRVTSPLRRLEDLVMHHHLLLRAKGLQPSSHDIKILKDTIRVLNRQAIVDADRKARNNHRNGMRLVSSFDSSAAS